MRFGDQAGTNVRPPKTDKCKFPAEAATHVHTNTHLKLKINNLGKDKVANLLLK